MSVTEVCTASVFVIIKLNISKHLNNYKGNPIKKNSYTSDWIFSENIPPPSPPYLVTFGCQKILGILQNPRTPSWGGWRHWCWLVWHIKPLGNMVEKYNGPLKAKNSEKEWSAFLLWESNVWQHAQQLLEGTTAYLLSNIYFFKRLLVIVFLIVKLLYSAWSSPRLQEQDQDN